MQSNSKISLDVILGIAPKVSTFTDVLRLLGSNYEIERRPAHQTKKILLPAKVVLHFQDTKTVAVFHDPDGELSPDAEVLVVGAEEGSALQTADDLKVGMAMSDAETIVAASYRLQHRAPGWVDIVSEDGSGGNFLSLHEEDGKVAFIGLYRRDDNL